MSNDVAASVEAEEVCSQPDRSVCKAYGPTQVHENRLKGTGFQPVPTASRTEAALATEGNGFSRLRGLRSLGYIVRTSNSGH
jgi:hypothetical protein